MIEEIIALGPVVLKIIGIDILLSGDNAVVIALACRNLPERQRRLGVALGALTAVAMRVAFAFVIALLLGIPWLRAAGAAMLVWIAIGLLLPEHDGGPEIASSGSLWRAVRTVAIADLVMSFDNVLAIVAAAQGNIYLVALGLILSVPLVMAGSTLILKLIDRLPVLVWAGAALLGWIAGELLVADIGFAALTENRIDIHVAAVAGATVVVLGGYLFRRFRGIVGWAV
jgi:YjbE family integral membrane protein